MAPYHCHCCSLTCAEISHHQGSTIEDAFTRSINWIHIIESVKVPDALGEVGRGYSWRRRMTPPVTDNN